VVGLTLDSGALMAAERGDRRFWALWELAEQRDVDVTVPANVVSQAYRGARQARRVGSEPNDEAPVGHSGLYETTFQIVASRASFTRKFFRSPLK
jgi:hypothetical protein